MCPCQNDMLGAFYLLLRTPCLARCWRRVAPVSIAVRALPDACSVRLVRPARHNAQSLRVEPLVGPRAALRSLQPASGLDCCGGGGGKNVGAGVCGCRPRSSRMFSITQTCVGSMALNASSKSLTTNLTWKLNATSGRQPGCCSILALVTWKASGSAAIEQHTLASCFSTGPGLEPARTRARTAAANRVTRDTDQAYRVCYRRPAHLAR